MKIDKTCKLPRYFQLKTILLDNIGRGAYPAGAPLPSIRELMAKYGLSFSTVNMALRELTNEKIIFPEHGRGYFVCVRNQKSMDRRPLTLILSSMSKSGVHNDIVAGMERVATARGYSLVLKNSDRNPAKEKAVLTALDRENTAGVLFFPIFSQTGLAHIKKFLQKRVPIVFVDRYAPELAAYIDYVVPENRQGAYQAAEYLIKLGHKNIAFLSARLGGNFTDERLAGFKKALADHGISLNEKLIRSADFSNSWHDVGFKMTEDLLKQRSNFTAILAVNDSLAIGAIRALKKHGLKTPDDVSVMGFGDDPQAELFEVPLTTVRQNQAEMGEKAAGLLIDKIEDRSKSVRHIEVKTALVIRASCGKCGTEK